MWVAAEKDETQVSSRFFFSMLFIPELISSFISRPYLYPDSLDADSASCLHTVSVCQECGDLASESVMER
jgi:hypothetical protein